MSNTTTQSRAGVPGPDSWIRHETVSASKAIQNVNALFDGASVLSGQTYQALVKCAGASRGRVRFKSTAAGTLALLFVRPNNSQIVVPYGAGNPSTVAVTANVETLLTTPDIAGEAQAVIQFVPSGNGTVSMCDWMAL